MKTIKSLLSMNFQKSIKAGAILFLSFLATSSWAQSAKDEVSIIQSLYGMEKRDAIKEVMELNDIDASKFWPIYDAYEIERKKLGAERIDIISEYAANYTSLTDAKADELANRVFKNNLAFDKLEKTYYGKVKKALSPLKAAQFMQVESYLQNAIRYAVQDELPFIGEFKK
jgi:hypothetical protein